MEKGAADTIDRQAKGLLEILKAGSDNEVVNAADDILVFCYRLLDEYGIVRSTSPRFKAGTFDSLRGVIYQIESRPEQALRSPEWRSVVEALLEDIASGRIVIGKKR